MNDDVECIKCLIKTRKPKKRHMITLNDPVDLYASICFVPGRYKCELVHW